MAKSIAKEIIISLLLCLAILLVLAVLLYSYIPSNKTIPELVSYTVPQEAKQVLEETDIDSSQVIMTYEINSSDLSTAQRTNDYNPGKVNPFSTYKVEQQTAEGGTTSTPGNSTNKASSSNSSSQQQGGSSSSSSSSSSEGTYFKDKGTK